MAVVPGVLRVSLVDLRSARRAADSGDAAVSIAELVTRSQAGDQDAFTELYARFHKAVHAVIFSRVSGRDADDLVQDVFADAWAKLESLRDPAAFPGWIMRLARNRAVDQLRKAGPVREVPDVAVNPPPRAEARAALEALRSLPDTYRETLTMRLVEGLSGPEIAERTGMTPESVRVNLHRGFKMLRERLGGGR